MRTLPFRFPLLGSAALLLALTACTAPAPPAGPDAGGAPAAPQQPSGQQPGAPATQQIKRGGTWIGNSTGSWGGSDPAMGQNAYQNWYYFGTYMLRRTPDTWKLEGDAIEKWEFSADGMELTLHVRKGVKWQNKPPVNGREVEARDVVYTLRSITGLQYPDLPPLRFPRKSQLEDMEDAFVVDKYTVKVKMKYPSSTFVDGLAEYRSPLHPDQIREHFGGRESLVNPHPDRYLSAGPFTLDKFVDSNEAILNRYPDYWEKGPDGQSKPYLDQIKMIWVPDTGTQIAAFIARQLSTLSLGNQETRNQILAARKDVQIIEYEPSSCWQWFVFNTKRKPFDDVRVRKAIALTLDQVETGKTNYGDFQGKPLWRYPGILPYAFPESLSQEELAKLQLAEHPKSQKTIDEAKQLMADAGYAGGFSTELLYGSGSGTADLVQLHVNQINRVFPNIQIRQVAVDQAINLEREVKGEFDLHARCFIHEPTAVAHMKTVYHSKGGRNFARYADPQLDDLLDKAGREMDEAKRKELLRQAQMRALENYTFIGTIHYVSLSAFQPEARGMRLGGGTSGLQMYDKEIWLDK